MGRAMILVGLGQAGLYVFMQAPVDIVGYFYIDSPVVDVLDLLVVRAFIPLIPSFDFFRIE